MTPTNPRNHIARVAVLLSGQGSNFTALHQAMEEGQVPAKIVLVLSNVADAPGLLRAKERGIPHRAIPHGGGLSRREHETKLEAALEDAQVDWICLAGYMRRLSAAFVSRYRMRLLNIHPSLLPCFPGLRAQKQALEHGVKVTGCTVHLVDELLDSGPIVVQRTVPVRDDDTVEALSRRLLEEEHKAYPQALRRLLTEVWAPQGRRLIFEESAAKGPLEKISTKSGKEG